MSVKRINEAFKRLYEDAQPVLTGDDDLRTALMDEVYRLMAKGGYIKEFEIAFQDVIERFYPDKAWWEVCDVNIFEHLFTSRDPEETVDAIVASIEGNEAPQESLEESPEIKECPVCGRNFSAAECSETENGLACPKCGEELIQTDSGEYVKYEESLSEATYNDCGGIMGEPCAQYTDADLKSYWDENNESDPVLNAYKGNYDAWLKDTIGNMDRVNEAIIRRLESYVSTLNEAEMSDEDRHDSELIRSMIQKMQARSNAAFTPEEKAVMAKYGITRDNWRKKLSVAGRDLNPDIDNASRTYYYRKGGYSNGTPSKINYADRARKLPARKQNQIAGDGSSSFYQNAHYNAHGIGRGILDVERNIRNDRMQEPIRDMERALKDRRWAQQHIDGAEDARAKRMAAAQAAYDKAKKDADWHYEYDTVDSARSRDRAQGRIDTLLRRKK